METENTVSLAEVVQEDIDLEEEALAVLGASDDQHCTYPQGAVARQALYACASCTPPMPDGPVAGICLACSLQCHDGHELYELYTKRNFRCDCGNSKFGDVKCQLCPEKDPTNPGNVYNHNFQGRYCSCNRPYPDPEDTSDDDMLQCVACEDWFHERHIGTPVPPDGQYSEMVCDSCMSRCPFLQYYVLQLPLLPSGSTTDEKDDVTNICGAPADPANCSSPKQEKHIPEKTAAVSSIATVASESVWSEGDASSSGMALSTVTERQPVPVVSELPTSTGESQDAVKASTSTPESSASVSDSCLLKRRKQMIGSAAKLPVAGFFAGGWRSDLCKCLSCQTVYSQLKVTFLTDLSDSCEAYEAKGREQSSSLSSVEKGMQAIEGQFNRTQQVEMFTAYNEMKRAFADFVRPFAAENKVVSEADIRHFFDQMKDRKRRDPGISGIPPAHCH